MKIRTLLVTAATLFSVSFITSINISKADNKPSGAMTGNHSHGHNMPTGDGHGHHSTMEITTGQPIPSVNLVVHKDPMRGWNLETKVSNFRFAPEHASAAAKPGEGHGHVYVNGKKVNRLYSSWYHQGRSSSR